MLNTKLRVHTIKIVIITSVVWCLFGSAIFVYFSDLCESGSDSALETAVGDTLQKRSIGDNLISGKKESLDVKPKKGRRQATKKPGIVRRILNNVIPSNPDGPGEMGRAVVLSGADEQRAKDMFNINQFNLLVSDRVALNRTLPDVRMTQCRTIVYPALESLPKVSVVIVFHNEAWSTLLRTLHSIINRSPIELIEEIIMVDDKSEEKFEHLKERLEKELPNFEVPVKLFRMPSRTGLIRARLKGAAEAKGEVLLFLDAHIETTEGWLEPLLARIAEDKKRIVCPIIDVISDDTFEYITASDMTWGGFNWKLNFRWYTAPNRELVRRGHDRTLPLQTPTIAGGLFAINRDFFYELGSYDEGMDVWGGENLEFSFRAWMCGGILEIATCSHVGHVFRKSTPYKFPGGTATVINHNSRRVAEVWMDEYKDFYYSMNQNSKSVALGDISERLALRKKLNCKSFRWYLENIYPEAIVPLDYHSIGEVRNPKSNRCLDTFSKKTGEPVSSSACHGFGGNQAWSHTGRGEIQNDELCLDATTLGGIIKMTTCHRKKGNQEWRYISSSKWLQHVPTQGCLSASVDPMNPDTLRLQDCNVSDPFLMWELGGFKG
ncbi:polypeptide N-acetylgalactosaminyltransferase 13-like [Paramacrobiotus metropolitanus]|uniref:polypeptide N-acetylgalactosaminyltransferase 13-like n=1 Tax=Paramacrobiotus metropolitanus TaxID=2943436 RepID=UPI0024462F05|nr:polypeptide N-acetylgalactosaminyltransferase 13-like [Paramacrobiotus metropolitanus]